MSQFKAQLAVSSRSFHRLLSRRRMALEQVPDAVREIGFGAVEIDDIYLQARSRVMQYAGALFMRRYFGKGVFFREYTSPRLLALHAAFEQAGTRLVAWSANTDFTLVDRPARWQMHYLEGAIATANDFGARLVCIRAGGSEQPTPDEMARCVDGLKLAADLAGRFHTRLALVAGRSAGITASAERTIQLVRAVNSPSLGICLCFDGPDCVELAPYAIHVHATARSFDAQGREPDVDYPACVDALCSAGYEGWISIEYDGRDAPVCGIMQTAELIAALCS
jgi:sugar phosphate isomerase/epimerase